MKKIIPISLFLCLCFVGFALAQEEVKEINETNLFRIYQVTNDSLNRLIYVLTFIVSVLMLFFLIGTATFLYRQYERDKETRRNAIAFEKYLELSRKNIKTREQEAEKNTKEIEKILKTIVSKKPKTGKELKEAQALLEKLKKEIQDLRGEVNFQKGKISTVSGLSSLASISGQPSTFIIGGSDGTLTASGLSIPEKISSLSSYCPKCSHVNEYGAKFCSDCGTPLEDLK